MFRGPIACQTATVAALAVFAFTIAAATAQSPPPKPKKTPPPEVKTPPAAKAAPKTATLIIDVDLPCTVTVNGEDQGRLIANATKTITVLAGEQVVRAVSEEFAEVVWRKAIDVAAGQRKAVLIELKPLVGEHRAAVGKREESARQELNEQRARSEAAAVETLMRRLEGVWEAEDEGSGKFTDTGVSYRSKNYTSIAIQRTASSLAGKFVRRAVITRSDGTGFTAIYSGDLTISIDKDTVRAEITTAKRRVGEKTTDYPLARVEEFTLKPNGELQVHVVFEPQVAHSNVNLRRR